MSLAGIRDMSIIETPPRDRLSIQTHVVKFDSEVIRRAISTELERSGQVFLVHNRVESIHSIANLVTRLKSQGVRVISWTSLSLMDVIRMRVPPRSATRKSHTASSGSTPRRRAISPSVRPASSGR